MGTTACGTRVSLRALGSFLAATLPDGRLVEYIVDGQGRRVREAVPWRGHGPFRPPPLLP
jgi:YD repeat-containing protein